MKNEKVTNIQKLFQPLYGKPCWQVQKGYGSFLTLEFGEPHLRIREPREIGDDVSEEVRKLFAKRSVHVRGDYHLWIYLCDWKIFSKDDMIANSESKGHVIERATRELNGQLLVSVTVTIFEFDLGGRLEAISNTIDFESTSDLWLLYEPSGLVFTLRADGKYCYMPGNTSPDNHTWQPLAINEAYNSREKW